MCINYLSYYTKAFDVRTINKLLYIGIGTNVLNVYVVDEVLKNVLLFFRRFISIIIASVSTVCEILLKLFWVTVLVSTPEATL